MNEIMIELYREASEFSYKICRDEGREGGTDDHIWNMLSTGKFAELIVKECASKVDWILAEGGKTQGDLIRQHFGVEK